MAAFRGNRFKANSRGPLPKMVESAEYVGLGRSSYGVVGIPVDERKIMEYAEVPTQGSSHEEIVERIITAYVNLYRG